MSKPQKTFHLTPEEEASVRTELDSVLQSSALSGSKRCQDFLEFIIARTLGGETENLTERFIGAELFGRPIDYDTTTDSIVRVRANDVRRRLTEYYNNHPAPSIVKINLSSGSYLPQFQWMNVEQEDDVVAVPADPLPLFGRLNTLKSTRIARHKVAFLGAMGILVLLVLGAAIAYRFKQPTTSAMALKLFWHPLIKSHSPVILCLPDSYSYWLSTRLRVAAENHLPIPASSATEISVTKGDTTTSGNIRAALSIMTLLNTYNVRNELRWPQETQAAELETENVIFIGAFSNPATMDLNQNLRFAFKRDDTAYNSTWMIVDHRQPGRAWSTTRTYPAQVDYDYAMITRVIDTNRKRVVISVGGLNWYGTQCAGEFLTNQAAMNELERVMPKGWENKNLQIVLQMSVSGGRAIHPQIVAAYAW